MTEHSDLVVAYTLLSRAKVHLEHVLQFDKSGAAELQRKLVDDINQFMRTPAPHSNSADV